MLSESISLVGLVLFSPQTSGLQNWPPLSTDEVEGNVYKGTEVKLGTVEARLSSIPSAEWLARLASASTRHNLICEVKGQNVEVPMVHWFDAKKAGERLRKVVTDANQAGA